VEANDATSICVLGDHYYFKGLNSFRTDHTQRQSNSLPEQVILVLVRGIINWLTFIRQQGDMKKAKFYLEAAAMAGNERARCNLGGLEAQSGNHERAVKHLAIAESVGCVDAMDQLRVYFKKGYVTTRESMKST